MLQDRLIPEKKQKLEDLKSEFPTTYERLVKALRKDLVIELTLDEAYTLCRFLGGNIESIYTMFE